MELATTTAFGLSCLIMTGLAIGHRLGKPDDKDSVKERALAGLVKFIVAPSVVLLLWQQETLWLSILLFVVWASIASVLSGNAPEGIPSGKVPVLGDEMTEPASDRTMWTALCIVIALGGWIVFGVLLD